MKHNLLLVLSLSAMLAVSIGVPALLARQGSKWGAIGCSTLISPFLMLGAIKLTAMAYWHFNHDPSGGSCSGGECGGEAYAAGFWPLLIPVFMVPALFVSLLVILLLRRSKP